MDFVLTYDVATDTAEGKRRLRRVAKVCESFGVRVQNSVFDLVIEPHELHVLIHRLEEIIDKAQDGIRIYRLSVAAPVVALGAQRPVSTTRGPLIL